MNALDLAGLRPLMDRTRGDPRVKVGLIDGPVRLEHTGLSSQRIESCGTGVGVACEIHNGAACFHGTFIAGILHGHRDSGTPGLCPDCTLLVRPLFRENPSDYLGTPNATPAELAKAILDCVNAGAMIINLSVGITRLGSATSMELREALNYAARRQVIIVAASGNQGKLAGSDITRHDWTISVAACDSRGSPLSSSNRGRVIVQRGILAPGERVRSLSASGGTIELSGTSVATPFVTGSMALLWSAFRTASPLDILAAFGVLNGRRLSSAGQRLDAKSALNYMLRHSRERVE